MSESSSASKTVSLPTLLTALQDGKVEIQGLLPDGSNYTFLAVVRHRGLVTLAVYKPTRGEQP